MHFIHPSTVPLHVNYFILSPTPTLPEYEPPLAQSDELTPKDTVTMMRLSQLG